MSVKKKNKLSKFDQIMRNEIAYKLNGNGYMFISSNLNDLSAVLVCILLWFVR